jgi:hypothetical protein
MTREVELRGAGSTPLPAMLGCLACGGMAGSTLMLVRGEDVAPLGVACRLCALRSPDVRVEPRGEPRDLGGRGVVENVKWPRDLEDAADFGEAEKTDDASASSSPLSTTGARDRELRRELRDPRDDPRRAAVLAGAAAFLASSSSTGCAAEAYDGGTKLSIAL